MQEEYSLANKSEREILQERALVLSKIEQEETISTNIVEIVTFSLGERGFCIQACWVKEIVEVPKITPIPYVPKFILGLVNLRGSIISVTDLEDFLGIGEIKWSSDSHFQLMVLEDNNFSIGILVDQVQECTKVAKDTVEQPLVTLEENKLQYLIGELRLKNRLYAYLNMEAILRDPLLVVE